MNLTEDEVLLMIQRNEYTRHSVSMWKSTTSAESFMIPVGLAIRHKSFYNLQTIYFKSLYLHIVLMIDLNLIP